MQRAYPGGWQIHVTDPQDRGLAGSRPHSSRDKSGPGGLVMIPPTPWDVFSGFSANTFLRAEGCPVDLHLRWFSYSPGGCHPSGKLPINSQSNFFHSSPRPNRTCLWVKGTPGSVGQG